jgi:hydroxyethylthiazole kinase
VNVDAYSIWTDCQKLREQAPLIHNITNSVVQEFTANALLALGASPIMSDAAAEVESLIGAAAALNLNTGTPTDFSMAGMRAAYAAALRLNKPIVLDPVAVGATELRTNLVTELLALGSPRVVRGNAAEIAALAGEKWSGKGVDSEQMDNLGEIASRLAETLRCVVVATGAVDYFATSDRVVVMRNGHPLLTRITGSGCVASALVAAFLAVREDTLLAATHALAVMNLAGELAAQDIRTGGPGSFRVNFIDAFGRLEPDLIAARLHVEG